MINKEKRVLQVSCVGIGCNVLLFFVKLYIGISANSISIFSDAVNNLADSLSCILAVACMAVAMKNSKRGLTYINSKLEQTLSFILSVVVVVVGFSFLYSSLERLMYPTPIFFSELYFAVIAGTVAVKIAMSVFYHIQVKATGSSTLKVMRTDSVMDACVTTITLVSFILINYTEFTVDAFAGIIISVVIVVEAVGLTKAALSGLLNYVKKADRESMEKELSGLCEIKSITYNRIDDETVECYIAFNGEADSVQVKDIAEKYGINAYIIKSV